ncbi:hypothetical protein CNMCM5793_005088 [Aspergillus hiratsukae]|uniref:Uncharacterized protein n=1 Tax=Aspergillus hiratsukae TaxID=1194566 RepID=A0A8H6UJ78_9EURO|nr:hypothetical protein CNMCM5793_005088 [Aspergillus hiratsukae]
MTPPRLPCLPCLRKKLTNANHRCCRRKAENGRIQKACKGCAEGKRACMQVPASEIAAVHRAVLVPISQPADVLRPVVAECYNQIALLRELAAAPAVKVIVFPPAPPTPSPSRFPSPGRSATPPISPEVAASRPASAEEVTTAPVLAELGPVVAPATPQGARAPAALAAPPQCVGFCPGSAIK